MAYIFAEMSETHRRAVIDIFNYFITESHAAFLSEAVDYPFFDHFLKMAHGYPAGGASRLRAGGGLWLSAAALSR